MLIIVQHLPKTNIFCAVFSKTKLQIYSLFSGFMNHFSTLVSLYPSTFNKNYTLFFHKNQPKLLFCII